MDNATRQQRNCFLNSCWVPWADHRMRPSFGDRNQANPPNHHRALSTAEAFGVGRLLELAHAGA